MFSLIEAIVQEAGYTDLVVKQRSITNLFPTFYDRVKVIYSRGIRFRDYKAGGIWFFKAKSSDKNLYYDVIVKFKDLDKLVYELTQDKRLWKEDLSGVDLIRLATEVFYNADLELYCSCPAFQYWGPAYILTQKDAKYTSPENRPPRIRNPKEYGAYCKHTEAIMEVLPLYIGTLSRYLKTFYSKSIEKGEEQVRKTDKTVRKATEFLKKRMEES